MVCGLQLVSLADHLIAVLRSPSIAGASQIVPNRHRHDIGRCAFVVIEVLLLLLLLLLVLVDVDLVNRDYRHIYTGHAASALTSI